MYLSGKICGGRDYRTCAASCSLVEIEGCTFDQNLATYINRNRPSVSEGGVLNKRYLSRDSGVAAERVDPT